MNICENHRRAVVLYEGRTCPVCDELAENDEKIKTLAEDVEALNEVIDEQRSQIEELTKELKDKEEGR